MIEFSAITADSLKYITRQKNDVAKFGIRKFCKGYGINDEFVSNITPFRRMSEKPATLSDSKYFISKFERKTGKDYLPLNWENMSEEEKVDFIVKERYSRLVAHKIMSIIKAEKVEHHFSLGTDGELLTHDVGEASTVFPENLFSLIKSKEGGKVPKVSIHNHNQIVDDRILEHINSTEPEAVKNMGQPFSGNDIANGVYYGLKSYLVDSFGNRFMFVPKKSVIGDKDLAFNIPFDIKAIHYNNSASNFSSVSKNLMLYNLYKSESGTENASLAKKYLGLYKISGAEYYKEILDLDKIGSAYKKYIEEDAKFGKFEIII